MRTLQRGRSSAGRRRGFTLVEVLATMVLIGIVLPAAMRGVSLALQAASHARHAEQAAMLAEEKLNEIVVSYYTVSSPSSGDFGPDWPEYSWTLEEETRTLGASVLTELHVTVYWEQRGEERSYTLATLLFDPASAAVGAP